MMLYIFFLLVVPSNDQGIVVDPALAREQALAVEPLAVVGVDGVPEPVQGVATVAEALLNGALQGLAGDLEEAAGVGNRVLDAVFLVPLTFGAHDVGPDAGLAIKVLLLTAPVEGGSGGGQVGDGGEGNGGELHSGGYGGWLGEKRVVVCVVVVGKWWRMMTFLFILDNMSKQAFVYKVALKGKNEVKLCTFRWGTYMPIMLINAI